MKSFRPELDLLIIASKEITVNQAIQAAHPAEQQEILAKNLAFVELFRRNNKTLLELLDFVGFLPYNRQKSLLEHRERTFSRATEDIGAFEQHLHSAALDLDPQDIPELVEIKLYFQHVYLVAKEFSRVLELIQEALAKVNTDVYYKAPQELAKVHEILDILIHFVELRGHRLEDLPESVRSGVREIRGIWHHCYNLVTRLESCAEDYAPEDVATDYTPQLEQLALLRQNFHRLIGTYAEQIEQTTQQQVTE